jgi:hypothetical protein
MKRIIFISAIIVCFLFNYCSKSEQLTNVGIIVGWNYGYCSTCGGFYLNRSNDTTMNSKTYYALNYSSSLNDVVEKLNDEYAKNLKPIYVYVEWQPVNLVVPSAPTNWVHVTYIKER